MQDEVGETMDSIQQAAIRKKSFELNYNGGTIWCEHLDGTDITEQIVETIVNTIMESDKLFRKIVFVGAEKHWHRKLGVIKIKGIAVSFINDYEKAKEWLI